MMSQPCTIDRVVGDDRDATSTTHARSDRGDAFDAPAVDPPPRALNLHEVRGTQVKHEEARVAKRR
jgi:hypothetical protein